MNISLLGDTSTHGGALISTLQDGRFKVNNIAVCADGSILQCPIHDEQVVAAITTRTFVNNLRILTHGALAACGATIISPDRGVYVE